MGLKFVGLFSLGLFTFFVAPKNCLEIYLSDNPRTSHLELRHDKLLFTIPGKVGQDAEGGDFEGPRADHGAAEARRRGREVVRVRLGDPRPRERLLRMKASRLPEKKPKLFVCLSVCGTKDPSFFLARLRCLSFCAFVFVIPFDSRKF